MDSSTQVFPAAQRESASVDSVSAEIIGILDTIDLPIMVVGCDCSVARFNQAAADALGLTISDVGRRPCNIRVLNEFPEIETLCSQVMADTAPLRREVRLADRWFLLRMAPYTGSDGQMRGAVLTFTNVTGFRESIGQALYEREYLKAILNTVNDAFVVLDSELRVQTGNRTFYEMFDISREAAQGVPLSSLGNDAWKSLEVWSSLRATLLDNHDFRTVEVQRDVPSGGRRVLLLDARRLAPRASVLVLLVLRDISERKQAEEAVRASEQGYRQLVSLMPAGVYACDQEGRVTFYNRRAAELWGREPKLNDDAEKFCGAFRCWLNDELLTPGETPMAIAVRQGKAFRDLDPVFERPDGSKLSVLVNIDPILDSQGNLAGAINVFQDVTLLKSIEGELRRKTGQLAAFLETAAVGLHRVGPDGIIQWANDAEMRMLGYSTEEYIGHHIAEFHADEPVISNILKQLTCGEKIFEREARLRCKDGSIKHVLIDSGVLWEDGKFIHTQCFTRDVTERKNAETALRESEAMLQTELADSKLLQAISAEMVSEPNMEALYEKLVDAAAAIMRSDFASMQMYYPERGELRLLALRGLDPEAAKTWEWVSRRAPSSCGEALRRGKRVVVTDVEQCAFLGSEGLAAYRAAGIASMQSTPLFSRNGDPVGMISTHWREPHEPTDRELRLFDILARLAADVIERRRAEMLLRETNERLKKVLEIETVGVMFWDLTTGCLVDANDTFLKMMGYSRADVDSHSLTWEKFTPPEYREISRAEIAKFRESGRMGPYEKEYFHKNGTRQWLLFAGSSLGKNQCVEFCVDISERKRIEQALQKSEQQLAADADALARLNAVGSRLWQATTQHQGINEMLDATIAMLGADMGNVQLLEGDTLRIVAERGFENDFLNFFRKVSTHDESACGRALRTGERIVIEDVNVDPAYAPLRDIARSAGYRAVLSTPLMGRDGKPRGMISTHWRSRHRPDERELRNFNLYVRQTADFIERWEIDQALRESEERFREVVNNSTAIIWVKDLEGRYLLINRCYEKRFHVTEEQFVGKTDFDLFPAEVAQTFRENDLKIISTGKPLEVEEIAPHDDGTHAYISIKFPLRKVDGSIYAVAGMATDITERKRVEESAARLAAIIRHSDDAIFSTDLNGLIKSWNRGAERLYGYAATEAIGQSITMLVPEGRENDEAEIFDRIRQGHATENYETLRRRKDGSIIDVSLTVSPIRDLNGKVIGASKVARDITDKVQAREKLEQTVAERTAQLRDTVAELEAFSYSVAHDMRAPLRAMTSYSRLLQSEFADALPAEGKHFTRRIAAGASRLDSLITDVLNYSKIARSEMTLEKVDVEKLARDIVDSYPNLQECGATILVQSPIPPMLGNSAALTQCFSNLLSNAVKFVAPGTKPRVLIRAEKNCDVVRLWFEDNGIGISEEGQKRIFLLFQRLNPAINFEGSGIGLTIVRKAVERMGGRVGVESQVGTGSRFWIELKGA